MRALATIGSFFALLGLYFLYGWVLVPLALPEVVVKRSGAGIIDEGPREEVQPYLFLLPENDWEQKAGSNLHYLKFNETILLFGKDEPNGNIVRLEPCTVLMVPGIDEPDLTDEQRQDRLRQAVILRTPMYAEIEFNREFNLNQVSQLEIVGGRLWGKVTVKSDMKDPGAADDLYLESEDIAISMTNPAVTQVTTIKDVRFRYGYHSGEGSILSMELTAADPKKPKSGKELSRIQFENMKRLNLVFPDDTTMAPKVVADDSPGAIQNRRILPGGPASFLNIKCQRQFSFQRSTQNWIAKFLGNVEMARTTPDGLTDYLHAEEVTVDFQEKAPVQTAAKPAPKKSAAASMPGGKMGQLEPVLFFAKGRLAQGAQPNIPARLTSKRNGGVVMTGDQILYDLRKNYVALETQTLPGSSPEVEIVLENRYRIRGQKGFEYVMAPDGAFGRLVSSGKGSLTGNVGDEKSPQNLFLSWNQMQATPDPERKDLIVLRLWDGVAANLEGFGKMTAGKLDLWCKMNSAAAPGPGAPTAAPKALPGLGQGRSPATLGDKGDLQPVDAVVSDKVRFENDKGVCLANRMDISFDDDDLSTVGLHVLPRWNSSVVPAAPGGAVRRGNTISQAGGVATNSGDFQNVIRQVQHLQGRETTPPRVVTAAPETPRIPLYEAAPNPPTASQVKPAPAKAAPVNTTTPTSVATQSLFGMQSPETPARYEISGNVISMKVKRNAEGVSRVDAMKIEGDVRIIETLLDTTRGDIVEIRGEEITVWNPSTETMQVMILGNPRSDAEFKGRGVRMVARDINISKPENKIWSNGMGRLIINSDKTGGVLAAGGLQRSTPTGPVASQSPLTPMMPIAQQKSSIPPPQNPNGPLVIEWNEDMRCDGKTIQFGDPKKTGSRVRTVFQDKNIWCNFMEVHLNRMVNFFEKENETVLSPEAETIRCLHKVVVMVRELDEAGQLKSLNEGEFETLTYQVKMNYFVATALGQGRLRRTFVSGGKGFSDTKVKLPGAVASSANHLPGNDRPDGLNLLSIWFQQNIQGTIRPGLLDVEINGGVQTIYCPVESWDDTISLENIKAARRLGYILECETLRMLQMPDPVNPKQGAVELRAQENAQIEGNRLWGKAREIRYNQAKDLVVFDGNARIKTPDSGLSAEGIEYNIENGGYKVRQSSGTVIGQ